MRRSGLIPIKRAMANNSAISIGISPPQVNFYLNGHHWLYQALEKEAYLILMLHRAKLHQDVMLLLIQGTNPLWRNNACEIWSFVTFREVVVREDDDLD